MLPSFCYFFPHHRVLALTGNQTTVHHFFGDFGALFRSVDDPRRPELITYPLAALAFAGVLMYLCRLGARRQIVYMFRENGPPVAKFRALFGTDTFPHGDTLNVTYGRLNPDQVQAVRVLEENKYPTRSARTTVRARNRAGMLRIRRIVIRREHKGWDDYFFPHPLSRL